MRPGPAINPTKASVVRMGRIMAPYLSFYYSAPSAGGVTASQASADQREYVAGGQRIEGHGDNHYGAESGAGPDERNERMGSRRSAFARVHHPDDFGVRVERDGRPNDQQCC